MSNKYSIKELAIGHSFPIKFRFIIDRNPHTSTLKKLTNIFLDRAHTRQQSRYSVEKENVNELQNRQNVRKIAQSKSKRVISQKLRPRQPTKMQKKEPLFLEMLNFGEEHTNGRQTAFRPYRMQQNYKKQAQTVWSPNKKNEFRSIDCSRRGKVDDNCQNEAWRVQKWESEQESMSYSYLMRMQQNE